MKIFIIWTYDIMVLIIKIIIKLVITIITIYRLIIFNKNKITLYNKKVDNGNIFLIGQQ